MKSLLQQIEERASGPRLAGIPVKSIWVSSLYRSAPATLNITWGVPETPAFIESEAPKGIEGSAFVRPADAIIQIEARERLYSLEQEILSTAWQLGAWDIRRCERAPLADPADYMSSRHGLACDFGSESLRIAGSPLQSGETAPDSLMREAAKFGYVIWHFIPLCLGNRLIRNKWGAMDKTLRQDGSCRRDQKSIAPYPLSGPATEPLTGYEHIYQLGRANHGNRSKKNGDRRA